MGLDSFTMVFHVTALCLTAASAGDYARFFHTPNILLSRLLPAVSLRLSELLGPIVISLTIIHLRNIQ